MADFEWDVGVAMMSVIDDDGFLGVQVDAYGEQQSGVTPHETHHFYGFTSRPLDPVVDPNTGEPDPTQACQMLYAMEAGKGHAWAMEDPRVVAKLPSPKPGEAMAYASPGNFTRWHADGSITHMTTDTGGDAAGKSVYSRVMPTGFLDFAPWGTNKFDGTGYHVLTASGARLDLGGIGGLPGPLAALGSYASIQAAAIKLVGLVTLGTGGAQQQLALYPPLLAYLTALNLALQAIQTAIAQATGVTTAPAVTAAVQAVAALPLPIIAATTSST